MNEFQLRKNVPINFPDLCPVCGKGENLDRKCSVKIGEDRAWDSTGEKVKVKIHNSCQKRYNLSKYKYFIAIIVCVILSLIVFINEMKPPELWGVLAVLPYIVVRVAFPGPLYLTNCDHNILVQIKNNRYAHEFEKLNSSNFVQGV